jgi:hypothetical protein
MHIWKQESPSSYLYEVHVINGEESVRMFLPPSYWPNCCYAKRRMDSTPCGGGLEYHRSPASRRRRRKENPVSGGIIGPPCFWGTQGWRLCSVKKNILLRNPKKWKPDGLIHRNRQIWQNLLRKAVAQKGLFCPWWWWWAQGYAIRKIQENRHWMDTSATGLCWWCKSFGR